MTKITSIICGFWMAMDRMSKANLPTRLDMIFCMSCFSSMVQWTDQAFIAVWEGFCIEKIIANCTVDRDKTNWKVHMFMLQTIFRFGRWLVFFLFLLSSCKIVNGLCWMSLPIILIENPSSWSRKILSRSSIVRWRYWLIIIFLLGVFSTNLY